MKTPPIVARAEWDEAWERLLVKEKELTRARDAMAAQRRRMPSAIHWIWRVMPNGGATGVTGWPSITTCPASRARQRP